MGSRKPNEVTTTQESAVKLDPRLEQRAADVLLPLFDQFAGMTPLQTMYQGSRVAAPTQAQRDVMRGTADAGNAFNMGFSNAADDLMATTQFNGAPVIDTHGMAMQGISPELRQFWGNMAESASKPAQTESLAPGQSRGGGGDWYMSADHTALQPGFGRYGVDPSKRGQITGQRGQLDLGKIGK